MNGKKVIRTIILDNINRGYFCVVILLQEVHGAWGGDLGLGWGGVWGGKDGV